MTNIITPQLHCSVQKKLKHLLKTHQKLSQFLGNVWAVMSVNNYVGENLVREKLVRVNYVR